MTQPTLYTAVAEPDGIQVDAMSDEPLLASLEWGGVNWPSSCRGGSCRSCIGKLRSGQVQYSIEWPGLTPEEKAEGYCLPCVAYPCSNVVIEQGW